MTIFIDPINYNGTNPLRPSTGQTLSSMIYAGAAHLHGTLWINWRRLVEQMMKKKEANVHRTAEEKEKKIEEKVRRLENAFDQIRNEELGKDPDDECTKKLIKSLTEFTDWSVSCSIKDATTRDLVMEVNKHQHFDKSCRKRGPNCRFGFPRFPCTKTIVAIPSKIRYKDNDELEKEMMSKSKDIKLKIEDILNNKDIVEAASNHMKEVIDDHIMNHRKSEEIETILEYQIYKKSKTAKSALKPKVSQDLLDQLGITLEELKDSTRERLVDYQEEFRSCMLSEEELDQIREERLDIILQKAGIAGDTFEERNWEYTEALSISSGGYTVILKRDVDELMINNYNPEWIKSWSGNMDMAVCLDYYAVITYITDYYMKDESGTVKVIKEALSNSSDENLKKRMNTVKNAFLTSRQAGECEIYYKMFPFLHLSHSNIGTEFIPTGFRKNRSRFLKQVPENQLSSTKNVIEVEGKEGNYYVEKEGYIEKYMRRPSCLNISYSQFVKRYEPVRNVPKKYSKKQFYIDIGKPHEYSKVSDDDDENISHEESESSDEEKFLSGEKMKPTNEKDVVFDGSPVSVDTSMALPPYIPLGASQQSGGFKWMKKRSERAIRFHKIKKIKDPHEWYYSEMLLYFPFTSEEELFPDDYEMCRDLYYSNIDKITNIQQNVMPYIKTVTEARERAEEFISNIGDEMDPTNEQDEEEARNEGEREHPDLSVKDPALVTDDSLSEGDRTFRKIELESDSQIFEKVRSLDADQRAVVDKMYNYAIKYSLARKNRSNPWPKPPLLMVHGGAGTGKSHVIDCVSQLVEKIFRTPGDDPNSPYVLRLAFTGNAASIIKGQTIHSALQLPFGNTHVTMSDKLRDLRRKQLKNLRLIIMDEVSLIKADMLYQIHFRLMEIFQNRMDFGNIGILFLGNLYFIGSLFSTKILLFSKVTCYK